MRIMVITEYRDMTEEEAKQYIAELAAQGMPQAELHRLISGQKVVKTMRNPNGRATIETVYQVLPDNAPKTKIIMGSP